MTPNEEFEIQYRTIKSILLMGEAHWKSGKIREMANVSAKNRQVVHDLIKRLCRAGIVKKLPSDLRLAERKRHVFYITTDISRLQARLPYDNVADITDKMIAAHGGVGPAIEHLAKLV